MARFERCNTSSIRLLKDSECYIVRGNLTLDDVNKLNKINRQIILIFENTRGQNSDIIGSLNYDKIKISVIGGYDYLNKNKYNSDTYISRTFYSPKNLCYIIKIFESIERRINYSWSESQKCMFCYKTIVETMHYQREDETDFENNLDVAKTLNGLLAGRSSCSGFSIIFKELMDRIGIECFYQNIFHTHSWNAVRLDGLMRLIDITWDVCEKKNDKTCEFKYFCRQDGKIFYSNKYHDIVNESDEIVFQAIALSDEELSKNIKVISKASEVHSKEMTHFTNSLGKSFDYLYLGRKDGLLTYIVRNGDKINYFFINKDGDIRRALDIDILKEAAQNYEHNISRGKLPDSLRKFSRYSRVDGTNFIVYRTDSKTKEVNEYVLIEPSYEGNKKILKRFLILTENDLVNITNVDLRYTIANYLLSSKRLKKKVEYYNGYVGYVSEDSQVYYNRQFEIEELGIQQRK